MNLWIKDNSMAKNRYVSHAVIRRWVMEKLFCALLVFGFFISNNTFAKEEILSVTDNDDNNEVYNLLINTNENTDSIKSLYKDTYVNGKKIRRDEFNPTDLKSSSGVILERRDRYNVLNLKSDNLDYDRGGRIIIDMLYNGITGERRNVDLELAKDQSGWKLFKGNTIISKFHVRVNKVILVGTVGIKMIIME